MTNTIAWFMAPRQARSPALYPLARVLSGDSSDQPVEAYEDLRCDNLTGLADRTVLVKRIERAMSRPESGVAILVADIDEFHSVNDTYGRSVGDAMLVAVAGRLAGLLRPDDTLTRLAADRFVILCENLDDTSAVGSISGRINIALNGVFGLVGMKLLVRFTVGVCYAGHGGDIPAGVLNDAGLAVNEARAQSGPTPGQRA